MTAPDSPDDLLCRFSDFIALYMGLRFPRERYADLRRGLDSVARELGFSDSTECAEWLMQAPLSRRQVEILASHLTVGETYFFRDQRVFEMLEHEILPPLIRCRRNDGKYLRLWSAGCATGEEPYSIAILLGRMLPDFEQWNVSILGTDINPSFLRKAADGVYGEWSFRSVPPWIRKRYFVPAGGKFHIEPAVQKRVVFSYLNLAEDLYPSLLNGTNAMDIIFCRNVIMYFSLDQQVEVVRKLHHCLVENGLLVVSPTEMSNTLFAKFDQVKFPGVVFFRRNGSRAAPPPQASLQQTPTAKPAEVSGGAGSQRGAQEVAPPPELYRQAEALYRLGRYNEAEQPLMALLALESENGTAILLLARTLANLGRLGDARELCEKAAGREKLDPGVHYLLATILHEMGQAEEEAAALRRALYLDDGLAVAHFAMGNLASRRGNGLEAKRHFANVLSSLEKMERDELVPFSEGVTAGRMREVVTVAMKARVTQ